LSISLWLSYLEWVNSTIIVLEKQILKQNVWFECCHCKQLLDQKSNWLQIILYHIERLLTVSIRKLCFWTFSSVSLHHIIISTSVKKIQLFSIWSKMFKNLICSADKYLVNFVKNQKRIFYLSCTKMKFWKRWIMYIYLIKKWFETDF